MCSKPDAGTMQRRSRSCGNADRVQGLPIVKKRCRNRQRGQKRYKRVFSTCEVDSRGACSERSPGAGTPRSPIHAGARNLRHVLSHHRRRPQVKILDLRASTIKSSGKYPSLSKLPGISDQVQSVPISRRTNFTLSLKQTPLTASTAHR